MEKVLIIGGSHRDIPLIQACKQLGYYVITLGSRSYYIGHRFADKFYKLDFSNIDSVEEVILNEKISYIIPGCSELAYINSVILTNRLGLNIFDNLETLGILFDKWKLKNLCKKLGVPTPEGWRINLSKESINIKLQYPLLLKPVDQSGGRGISIVKNKEEIKEALKKIVTNKDYAILEEYIEGRLIAYSCVLSDGNIVFDFTAEDTSFINPFNVSTSYPVWDEDLKLKLRGYISKLINHLNLKWGVVHAQFIDKENKFYLIDITRRIPGDLFPFLIEFSTGFPYSWATIMSYMGRIFNLSWKSLKRNIVRHCVFSRKNGKFVHIKVPKELENRLIYRLDIFNKDDEITDYLVDRVSIMFFEFKEIDRSLIDMIKKNVEVVVN